MSSLILLEFHRVNPHNGVQSRQAKSQTLRVRYAGTLGILKYHLNSTVEAKPKTVFPRFLLFDSFCSTFYLLLGVWRVSVPRCPVTLATPQQNFLKVVIGQTQCPRPDQAGAACKGLAELPGHGCLHPLLIILLFYFYF
jgi:hypothetical protein